MADLKSLVSGAVTTGPTPGAPAQEAVCRKCQCNKNTKRQYFFFLYPKITMPFATINVA